MTIALCTLCLNEMEWLPKLYEQHRDWPDMVRWVFVESADRVYAETNPSLVSADGLSLDGTGAFLQKLAECDRRITYRSFGFCGHSDPAQGKCEARSVYLDAIEEAAPDFFVVLDADEFYPQRFQRLIGEMLQAAPREYTAFCFKHRDIWRPPSIAHEPLFAQEVTGGFWDIPYCRGWRWQPSLKYRTNHNTPEDEHGRGLDKKMKRWFEQSSTPYDVHMAFASSPAHRAAKHAYYQARGEGRVDFRGWYVESRAAYSWWKPGNALPRGARVVPYDGLIPECFQDGIR